MKVETVTLIYSIIIVVVIIIIGILMYYYLPSSSWVSFKLNYGDTFQSSSVASNLTKITPSHLRWRNCIFTVVYNGKTYTRDVTGVLNAASSVYLYYSKTTLDYDLIRPLNYVSFPITGFTYVSTIATKPCLSDADCQTTTLKNNMCIKMLPDPSKNIMPTGDNCNFYGGSNTASSNINPASDPDLTITINTNSTGNTTPVYQFPTVPAKYATSVSYNTLYCKPNGDDKTFTVDWLQLTTGACSLNGLSYPKDSVTLTGSFRVFPYL